MNKLHWAKRVPDGSGGTKLLGTVGACGTKNVFASRHADGVTCERCKLRIKYGQRGDKISKPNAEVSG